MKITFLKNHQSALTGNSAYKVGDQADFEHVKTLIGLGIVREGWEPLPKPATPKPIVKSEKPKRATRRKAKS